MEIQNIIQTQPSASTPTEPFLARVHNSLCNTSTPLWHLPERRERHRQPGREGPSSSPAPHCWHHQHPCCALSLSRALYAPERHCKLLHNPKFYLSSCMLYFNVTFCKFSAIHDHHDTSWYASECFQTTKNSHQSPLNPSQGKQTQATSYALGQSTFCHLFQ